MELVRKQAPRLARPATRYWKGKAPKGVVDAGSDSEDEDVQTMEDEGDIPIGGDQDVAEQEEEGMPLWKDAQISVKAMNVTLKDVSISKDGKVIVAGREESGKTTLEKEESDEESEDIPQVQSMDQQVESSESSEYETDSEEDGKPVLKYRPVFVPKRARITIAEKEAIAQDSEDAIKKRELEAEERRRQSHDLVAETIKRELAEKEKEDDIIDVDDTDGLDPAAEFEAWRLRELSRIKKEKEEELRREEEREEVERRRTMPEEQRLKEDLERAQKLRDEKPKGQQKFLQKYWHKGAFYQDEEILKRHDYTQATASTVDVSLLPKVMQVKNFGKRSRTKYTHLLDQDTTVPTGGFGSAGPIKSDGKPPDGGGCFTCGGPHLKKDCPHNTGPLSERGGSGPGSAPATSRQWGNISSSDSRHDNRDVLPRRDSGWKSAPDRHREGHTIDDRYGDDSRMGHERPKHYYAKRSSGRKSRSPSMSPHRNDIKDKMRERNHSREQSTGNLREKRRRLD